MMGDASGAQPSARGMAQLENKRSFESTKDGVEMKLDMSMTNPDIDVDIIGGGAPSAGL